MEMTDSRSYRRPQVRGRLHFTERLPTGWTHDATVEVVFLPIDAGGSEPMMPRFDPDGVTETVPWTVELTRLVQQLNQVGQTECSRLNALRALGEMVP
jgi:hypothetical protein